MTYRLVLIEHDVTGRVEIAEKEHEDAQSSVQGVAVTIIPEVTQMTTPKS